MFNANCLYHNFLECSPPVCIKLYISYLVIIIIIIFISFIFSLPHATNLLYASIYILCKWDEVWIAVIMDKFWSFKKYSIYIYRILSENYELLTVIFRHVTIDTSYIFYMKVFFLNWNNGISSISFLILFYILCICMNIILFQ